jgi:hypothetical protein
MIFNVSGCDVTTANSKLPERTLPRSHGRLHEDHIFVPDGVLHAGGQQLAMKLRRVAANA